MNPKVDFYFTKPNKWQAELLLLREIALDYHLTEELKWGQPCYTFNGKNIVLIHDFKEYCAFLFFKGAIMKDPEDMLIQQTKNVQSARQVRFTNASEIKRLQEALKSYILQAVEIEEAGLKVTLKAPEEFAVAEEFRELLDKNKALKKAFDTLTPGRQRAYLLYFSSPKQAKTRAARVEKCVPSILEGKGLND